MYLFVCVCVCVCVCVLCLCVHAHVHTTLHVCMCVCVCVHPLAGMYIPSCDEDGYYRKLQCDQSRGECWCVDPHGGEMMGSRIHGNPDCGKESIGVLTRGREGCEGGGVYLFGPPFKHEDHSECFIWAFKGRSIKDNDSKEKCKTEKREE